MQELIEEVKNEITEEERTRVKNFVRGKINRQSEINKQIKTLENELETINEALDKISAGNYEDVPNLTVQNASITFIPQTYQLDTKTVNWGTLTNNSRLK